MNFLVYVYRFLVSIVDPGKRLKYKMMALLSREIHKNKYKQFYNTGSKEALPMLGRFFFDVYGSAQELQKTLARAEKSAVLKELIFNRFLDERGKALLYGISEDYIKKAAGSRNLESLTEKIRENGAAVEKYFNEARCAHIDDVWIQIILFGWLANFDYVELLRRFTGASVPAESVDNFAKIKFEFISENIKDFLAVSAIMEEKVNWPLVFEILAAYDETMPSPERWLKLVPALMKVHKSQILTLIIRYEEENPDWEIKYMEPEAGFVCGYIKQLVNAAFTALSVVESDVKKTMIDELVQKIFPDTYPAGANYYNEAESSIIAMEGRGTYTNAAAFNYLLSFFHIYGEEVRELTHIILIKGTWVSRDFSNNLSQIIHNLNERFIELSEFDRSVGESGERGIKLRTYLSKSSIGKRHGENLNKYLTTLNVEARNVIQRTVETLEFFHKLLGDIETDHASRRQTMLRNWNELDSLTRECISTVTCIQKTGDLLTLVNYLREDETQK